MKLKALVYQQKEWNPLQLSTGFPVFPVENITEEALAVWKLHAEEVLLITSTDAGIQAAVRAHMAVAAYADPAFPGQSYAGAWMVIEGFEEVDDEFLERIFQRCHGQPWEIARTKRCVIRELSLEDLPALEKLYQKEVDFVEYRILVPDIIPERYARFAEVVAEKNELHQAVLHKRSDLQENDLPSEVRKNVVGKPSILIWSITSPARPIGKERPCEAL